MKSTTSTNYYDYYDYKTPLHKTPSILSLSPSRTHVHPRARKRSNRSPRRKWASVRANQAGVSVVMSVVVLREAGVLA
jgi:hypothetical protein